MTENIFSTSDIGTATFLLSHKESFIEGRREGNDKRLTFIFALSETVEERASEFMNGGLVEAKTFLHTLRDLKALTYKKE